MKNILNISLATLLSALFFIDCFMFPDEKILEKASLETTDSNGFAIVELFTSEGCSSCPPADELMAKLQDESKHKNIYLLAYHVDYWDRLGWKDQFSSNEFTTRQQHYQDWLHLNVMYTPQFVINGTTEFAGYNKSTLYDKVSDALKIKQAINLALTTSLNNDSLEINFKINALQKNTSLFVATIQKQAVSKVDRGENGGHTLHHVQIVKQLESIILDKNDGSLVIPKPDNFNSNDWEIIGFVQNNSTGKITAATKSDLK